MLPRLLEAVMQQRVAVLLATAGLTAVGIWSALRLTIDAVAGHHQSANPD